MAIDLLTRHFVKFAINHGLLRQTALLVSLTILTSQVGAAPEIQHWNTDNGTRVYFVPARDLAMVDVRIVFDAGSARDGEQQGLAVLTNALLDDGAGGLNADQIAEHFEALGAQISTDAYQDMALLDIRSLSEANLLQPALTTAAQLLFAPTFPAAAIERERQRMLVALQSRQQSPAELAEDAFFQALYPNHPYANPPHGTATTLAALQRSDILRFHKQYYVANNAIIAIVGDVDRSTAEKMAVTLVGKLPPGQAAAALPEVKMPTTATNLHIEHPSSQTHILIGQPGMTRNDADYFPLYVGNHILGGSGLVSRISEEIREKRGLSYSAYSYFSPMRARGPFILGLQTRNDQTQQATQVARETLQTFISKGPTDNELREAKQNITGGFPLRLSSNKKIAGMLAMIGFYQLPLDYLETFNSKVEQVNIADIQRGFSSRVTPSHMATITVGTTP